MRRLFSVKAIYGTLKILGCPFKLFQNREDECSRQEAGDYKDEPELPQIDLFPEEAADKE